jgi:hypothetical protein
MEKTLEKFDNKHYFTPNGSIDRKRSVPNHATSWKRDKKGRIRNDKIIGKEKRKNKKLNI